ncbi:hypothetical protein M768_13735 [Cellulosimicrobium cellulans F16]|uniref:PASTA domain-containing protein n=1 Tax=Cellulosimicrobium cellulans F16 TaxID=1350482 RepID=A0A0M0F4Q9_CELCE|nr:hypothetical protein [Cellulosimicrobium cellulans]KON72564.1 hypothetical protein M768_13735 [Cellulosimicrobium cellulans F16]
MKVRPIHATALLMAAMMVVAGCSGQPSSPGSTPSEELSASTDAQQPSASPTMPDVVGLTGSAAADELADLAVEVRFVAMDRSGDMAANEAAEAPVVQTYPAAGDDVRGGAGISLFMGASPGSETAGVEFSSTLDGDVYQVLVSQTLTPDDARAIVTKLQEAQTAEGGYFVQINCSTGATVSADNRQANGKFAIGTLGAAQTGLEEGAFEATLVDGATCP